MAVIPQPQFTEGGPKVVVRNTFIDIEDDDVPPQVAPRKVSTAPAAAGARCTTDDDTDEDVSSKDPESDDDENQGPGVKAAALPAPSAPPAQVSAAPASSEPQAGSVAAVTSSRQLADHSSASDRCAGHVPSSSSSACRRPTQETLEACDRWSWAYSDSAIHGAGDGVGYSGTDAFVQGQPSSLPGGGTPLDAGSRPGCDVPCSSAPSSAPSAAEPTGSTSFPDQASGQPPPGAAGQPQVDDGMPAVKHSQMLTQGYDGSTGNYRVHWTVDARKLKGNDKHAVSPPFVLSFGGQFPQVTFKMMIYPKVESGKACFKQSGGRGYVQVKCETDLTEAVANVSFRISIGSGDKKQAPRGPVHHDFASSAVCGLPRAIEVWNFVEVVEPQDLFVVCLEIVPRQ